MQYHSTEYEERYAEFARVFLIACAKSTNLQIWAFNKVDDLESYLKLIPGLDHKALMKHRRLEVRPDKILYVDGRNTKDSGFRDGNIFLPLTSVVEVYERITGNPNADTYYIPHSKAELESYLKHFPKSIAV
jgi:hypothetical protein